MSTTSLWAVRGTIRDVVAYVKDPNKTANPDYDLQNVLSYAVDNDKTEKQYFVTGLNCSPHFAFERMSATKPHSITDCETYTHGQTSPSRSATMRKWNSLWKASARMAC